MKEKPIKIDDDTFHSYVNIIRKSGRGDIPFLSIGEKIRLTKSQALELIDIYFNERLFEKHTGWNSDFSSITSDFVWRVLVAVDLNNLRAVTEKYFDRLKEVEYLINVLSYSFIFYDMKPSGVVFRGERKRKNRYNEIFMEVSCRRFSEFKFNLFHSDIMKFILETKYEFIKGYNGVDRFLEVINAINRYEPRLFTEKYTTDLKSNLYDVLGGSSNEGKTI